MNDPTSDTPIADAVVSELGDPSAPWPNKEPVIDGISDVSQDPNFIVEDKVTQ